MFREEIDDPSAVSAYSDGEPYVGPRPFKRDDRDIFFGRQRETLELTSLIKAHPELLIYAQSGAGKTSLIDAQLVPTLEKEEEFEVLPLARVRSRTAQSLVDDKIKNIYMFNALADLSADSLAPRARAHLTLSDFLQGRPRAPIGPSEETSDSPQAPTPTELEEQKQPRLPRAIIFDQFEELFTLYPHRYKDRQDFFNQVRDALEGDQFLRVVFSMREDYIAELDPYIDTLPQKLSTRFRLEPLRKPNALKAVTEPLNAERVISERRFADNAAEALVESLMLIKVKTVGGEKKEVLGEFVDPVQLQVVCQSLWTQLPPNVDIITQDHLKKYANIDAALLTYYENSIRRAIAAASDPAKDALTASGESAAFAVMEAKVRKWFEKLLITPEGKRSMIPQGEEDKGTGTPNTAVLPNNLVTELENQHLIRAEIRGEDDKWYELSHDRLIAPIIESNRRRMLQQPWAKRKAEELEARCLNWIKAQKDPKLLLEREELAKAQNWRESAAAQAIGSTVELDLFIRESQAAIEAEDHRQTRLLASEQSARANAEHQRARVFRLGLVVAILLLVIASMTSVFAVMSENRAEAAAAAAKIAKDNETTERQKAVDALKNEKAAKELANFEKQNADDERQKAVDARLAAQVAEASARAEKKRTEVALQAESVAKASAEKETEKAIEQRKQSDSLRVTKEIERRSPGNPELGLALALAAENKWPSFPRVRTDLRSAFVNWPEDHFVLSQKDESVQNAIFTPDGKSIVITSVSEEGENSERATVKVWSVTAKKYILDKVAHDAGIAAIAVSNDSTRLATEGADGTGRIWSLTDGTYKELKGLTGPWPAITFSRDGKFVASEGTIDEKNAGWVVLVWNAEDPRNTTPPRALLGHESPVTAIAFSPTDHSVVAAGSKNGTVLIWDQNKKEPKKLVGHTDHVNSVSFDPSGKLLVTASNDGTARVWDKVTGEEWPLTGNLGRVTKAIFSDDGQRILTVSGSKSLSWLSPEDNVVRVWDVEKRALALLLGGHTGRIRDARFSPNGRMIVTASEDGTAHIWSAITGAHLMPLKDHNGWVLGASFSPDNKSVLTTTGQSVHVWRIPPPTIFFARGQDDKQLPSFVSIDFHSDERIVTLGTDGSVRFWDPKTREEKTGERMDIPRLPGTDSSEIGDNPADIKRSPDGRYVAVRFREQQDQPDRKQQGQPDSTKNAGIVNVWDTREKKYIPLVPSDAVAKDTPISKLEFSPKGKYLLTAGQDGTATLWETASWKGRSLKIQEVAISSADSLQYVSPGRILAAAFDSSEEWVVTGHQSGFVEVFTTADGEYFSKFRTHQKSVLSVAFGRGNRFITGGDDATAALWTIDSVQPLVRIAHPFPVIDARFSDDDTFIVTACEDNIVRVWENTTAAAGTAADKRNVSPNEEGILVAQFNTLDAAFSVALSPDNKYLAAGLKLGWGQVFSCEACLPFERLRSEAIKKNPRELTKAETSEIFGPEDDVKPPKPGGKKAGVERSKREKPKGEKPKT